MQDEKKISDTLEGILYQIATFNSECEKLNKELEKGNISNEDLEDVSSLIINYMNKTESIITNVEDFESKYKNTLQIDHSTHNQSYEEAELNEILSDIFYNMTYLKSLSQKCSNKVNEMNLNL